MVAGKLNDPRDPSRDSLEELLAQRAPEHVTYEGWEAIDRAEKAAGEPHGRPRVKITRFEELLDAARDRVR
jgi:ferredoxin/flavodoxin---NADP+ reductase